MDPNTEATAVERPATRKPVTTGSVAAAFAAARAGLRSRACRRFRRPPLRITTPEGARVVLMPLPDGSVATVEAEDYDLFLKLGLSTRWFLDDNGQGDRTVRFRMPSARPGQRSNNASVSRVVLNAGSGERVRYRDKNPLNLTRANLYLAEGFAKGRELATVRSLERGEEF